MTTQSSYTFGTTVAGSLQDVRPRVEAALKAEGFGVLTEIDVTATMKVKLGVEFPPYLILGACNPPLAHRALLADASIGALLPCNVVLRADGASTIVEAMDPLVMLGLIDQPEIHAVAEDARARLQRVVATVEAGG